MKLKRGIFAVVLAGVIGAGSSTWTRAQDRPTAPAAPAAAASAGDWSAFHRGGELRGEAAPVGPPPMNVRWTYYTDESDPAGIEGGAAIVGDTVYVGDNRGKLHAVDLATGKRKWAYNSDNGFSTVPLVLNGRVYAGDLSGVFHCVSADKGEKVWTVDSGSPIKASANALGDRIVFGNDGADIYCVAAADGKELWKATAGDRVNSAPAVGHGMAFVSGCDAKLRGLDLDKGEEKFGVDLGALAPGSPAVFDGGIVIGTDSGRVVCFSPDGTRQLWAYEQVDDKSMVYSSPAVSDGVVVVGARDRQVHAIDARTGTRKWVFKTRGDVESSPAVSGGRVYVGRRDKKLYVFDLKTGEKLWEFTAGRSIVASPAVGQGVVVIGDSDGALYCLEPKK
jgi:outer membrane protein assembly factor BamB